MKNRHRRGTKRLVSKARVHRFVEEALSEDLHVKRILSLTNGVVGVLHAAMLSVHAIGQGLAWANHLKPRHAVKQVDRLLSNPGIDVWKFFQEWVLFVVAQRKEIVVALDWTDFESDGHATIMAHLVTSHGRATPLVWKTAPKTTITDGERNDLEDEVLMRLHEILARDVQVTILGDRAFGDIKLYEYLDRIGWKYIIRFRNTIQVTDSTGTTKPVKEWLQSGGRARLLRNVEVTAKRYPVPGVVAVHAKKMKDPWFLATNRADLTAAGVIKLYGRRFTIEETFRDLKDPRFGFGLAQARISKPERRDRLILLAAMAHALLTLLGAASEAVGYDRWLKVNTVKKRTHSLFRQGSYWFSAMVNMDDDDLRPLMDAFDEIVRSHAAFREAFGFI